MYSALQLVENLGHDKTPTHISYTNCHIAFFSHIKVKTRHSVEGICSTCRQP